MKFIRESDQQVGKREIARAFGLQGSQKIALKALLKDLVVQGDAMPGHKQRVGTHSFLPNVEVIDITHTDKEGDLFAKPAKWESDAAPPTIIVIQEKQRGPRKKSDRRLTVGVGDRVLARIKPAGDDTYEARPMKVLQAAPTKLVGVYEPNSDGDGGFLRPVDKKYRSEVSISARDVGDAKRGDLVSVEIYAAPKFGPEKGRIIAKLGQIDASKNLSLIAIHTHGIPHVFSEEALAQAAKSTGAPLGNRTDLRNVPLITIDGEDARDFDDAVWAEPDTDPGNEGGWHILVAIADVAWYVRDRDALDKEAFLRGNSVYFPDRVVPMLPEELSNGWCSLKPNEERPCMAAHMWITADGKLIRHKVIRGLMRSVARLTYTQVQAAKDGHPDEMTKPLMEHVINPLYGAYAAFLKSREKRGTLELDLVERKIVVNRETGDIVGVQPRERYDSHKLIEEFMIAANVAAAETLAASAYPCAYRVHDKPDPERVDALRDALQTVNLAFPHAGAVRPQDFNRVLGQVHGTPNENMVNTLVLRTQAQAVYSPENIGHFGLGLKKYTHFTSPIRRYSDLLVHRALIAACKLGEGGWNESRDPNMVAICEAISMTERRASAAERQTVDRFTAAFLADRAGAVFRGRINGVSRFGVFVNLDETGADGILPMRNLPQDFYDVDERNHTVVGRRGRLRLRVGDVIDVKLVQTDEIAGSIVFEYSGRTEIVREDKAGQPVRRAQKRNDPRWGKKRRRK